VSETIVCEIKLTKPGACSTKDFVKKVLSLIDANCVLSTIFCSNAELAYRFDNASFNLNDLLSIFNKLFEPELTFFEAKIYTSP